MFEHYDLHFIGNPYTSDEIRKAILSSIDETNQSKIYLIVGSSRAGKDYAMRSESDEKLGGRLRYSINANNRRASGMTLEQSYGSANYQLDKLRKWCEETQEKKIISLQEINAFSEHSGAPNEGPHLPYYYNQLLAFAQEKNIPLLGSLYIPPTIAKPWDQQGIEAHWKDFMQNTPNEKGDRGLGLTLPKDAAIHFLPMDPQLCALKLWYFKGRSDQYGADFMCIPDFRENLEEWKNKDEKRFFGDLGEIMGCALKTYTQVLCEQADHLRSGGLGY